MFIMIFHAQIKYADFQSAFMNANIRAGDQNWIFGSRSQI